MKHTSLKLVLVATVLLAMLSACNTDTLPPSIYLLDGNSNIIPDSENDSIVLLYSVFEDPGVLVEDNVTSAEQIDVDSDIDDVLSENSIGYQIKAGDFQITYTATDEAGNTSEKVRNVTIANISDPFAGTYEISRTATHVSETTYNTTVSADTRVAGRISFPKVYAREIGGEKSYFKIIADLYSENLTDVYSSRFGYLGKPNDTEIPFFEGFTYPQAIDSILTFTRLKIAAQEVTDNLGNTATIAGREQDGLPLSRIEYVPGSKTIYRVILELNVTIGGVSDSNVIETYSPN